MGETIPRGVCTTPAGPPPRISKQRHLSPESRRRENERELVLSSMESRIALVHRNLRFLEPGAA